MSTLKTPNDHASNLIGAMLVLGVLETPGLFKVIETEIRDAQLNVIDHLRNVVHHESTEQLLDELEETIKSSVKF